jgi:hypothetical protein
VIIKTPPLILSTIENEGIVVATVRALAIVYNDRVQVVWTLLLLDEGVVQLLRQGF